MESIESALIDIQREQAHLRETQAVQAEQIKQLFESTQETKALTKSVQSLTLSVEKLANSVKANDDRLDMVSGDIKELKEKPVKRWEKLVEVCITVLVTAAITYFITKGGTP